MDYAEILCQAVDTIISKKLESVKFNKTITCTVANTDRATEGIYIVNYNDTSYFTAYSENYGYRKGEVVDVIVPNNDYDGQKTIIGKHTANSQEPYTVLRPFDHLIDVSNNLLSPTDSPFGLIANGEIESVLIEHKQDFEDSLILKGYTRLGVRADFKTLLGQSKLKVGDYGLLIQLVCREERTLAQEQVYILAQEKLDLIYDPLASVQDVEACWSWLENTSGLVFNKIKVDEDIYIEDFESFKKATEEQQRTYLKVKLDTDFLQVRLFTLSSEEDMYGDPYNFIDYFSQEQIYDISDLGQIIDIRVNFYQKKGSFIDFYDTLLPVADAQNLFAKNLYLCVGYDMSEFDNNAALLVTTDSLSYTSNTRFAGEEVYENKELIGYKNNEKTVNLRWIQKYENGKGAVIDQTSNVNGDYEIRWYRYKLGAPSADQYSGVYWERTNLEKTIHTEEKVEQIEEIKDITNYYLIFHQDGVNEQGQPTYAAEYKYTDTFIPDYLPEYPKRQNSDRGLKSGESYVGYWTPAMREKYGLTSSVYDHAFVGMSTSQIPRWEGQSWEEIYRTGFVYHANTYSVRDYYTGNNLPSTDIHTDIINGVEQEYKGYGCLHRVGFWERLTITYYFYWLHPEEFNKLNPELAEIFGVGGNPNFTTSTNDRRTKMTTFANSIATWGWIIDPEDGMGDYVPVKLNEDGVTVKDEETYNRLYEAGLKLFQKIDDPYIRTTIHFEPDNFSYTFYPDVETDEEKVKVIILYNDEVIRSNIVTFVNEDEVINGITAAYVNGLNIWCLDNTYGNYLIYDQGNKLLDSHDANKILNFRAHFDKKSYLLTVENEDSLAVLSEAVWIKWTFPRLNSMIVLPNFNYFNGEYIPTGREFVTVTDNEIIIQRYGDPNNSYAIDNQQPYQIKNYFSQSYTNNTIKCTILKDNIEYNVMKELTFGTAGTSGTDTTLVLDFNNNEQGLILGQNKSAKVTARLYRYDNKEVKADTIHYEWSWKDGCAPTGQYAYFNIDSSTVQQQSCVIDYNLRDYQGQLPLLILQCKVTGWGDFDLYAYLPVPIHSDNCSFISGATTVIYPSSGAAYYYKDPYKLYDVNDNIIPDLEWKIWNPKGESPNFIGKIGEHQKNCLQPPAVMIDQAAQYGVYVHTDEYDWYQPILTMKNQYPSATLNKWDGKSIDLDYDKGHIVAPAIAAGKKESDNTFSGVMLGDWSAQGGIESSIGTQTGLYGFQHGAMSYAFKEDGTAFIGKSGSGRIEFDGNKATIKTPLYYANDIGMLIDLDDGYIDIKGGEITTIDTWTDNQEIKDKGEGAYYKIQNAWKNSQANICISADGNVRPYFEIKSEIGNPLIHISNTDYYLQTDDFEKPSDESDGAGVKLGLKDGRFEAYGDFTLQALKTTTNALGKKEINGIMFSSQGTEDNPYLQIIDKNKKLVYFDSTNGYLQSKNYNRGEDSDSTDPPTGFKIDLNNGKLIGYDLSLYVAKYRLNNLGTNYILDHSAWLNSVEYEGILDTPYFVLQQLDSKELLKDVFRFSKNQYFVKSLEYDNDNGIKIDFVNNTFRAYQKGIGEVIIDANQATQDNNNHPLFAININSDLDTTGIAETLVPVFKVENHVLPPNSEDNYYSFSIWQRSITLQSTSQSDTAGLIIRLNDQGSIRHKGGKVLISNSGLKVGNSLLDNNYLYLPVIGSGNLKLGEGGTIEVGSGGRIEVGSGGTITVDNVNVGDTITKLKSDFESFKETYEELKKKLTETEQKLADTEQARQTAQANSDYFESWRDYYLSLYNDEKDRADKLQKELDELKGNNNP